MPDLLRTAQSLAPPPAVNAAAIRNCFTVDVEDYFHVEAFAESVSRDQWDGYESRVVRNTERILDLLAEHGVRGTFYVLGWVADRYPELVQQISAAGHEIGCHSYWHRLVYSLTPDEFRDDLRRATDVLQQISGQPVRTYRAPSFSITRRSLWALDILADEGYRVDSSIFPVVHDTYGIPDSLPFPYTVETVSGQLVQFPPSTVSLGRRRLPVGGGGYFRLYPARLSLMWLRQINQRDQQSFMFYIHPWEIDPGQPRLPGSLRSRFRHYQNLGSTERKLHQLLAEFRYATVSEVVGRSSGLRIGAGNH